MSRELKRRRTDYLLELAIAEQLEDDPEQRKYEVGGEKRIEHVFSEAHNKRMKKIFKMAEKIEKRSIRKRYYRRIVAGFVLVFCLSMFTVSQVEAFRLPILQFITEVNEKYTIFGVKDEYKAVTEKFMTYEPIYMPNGFVIEKVNEGKVNLGIRYWNEETNQTYTYFFSENIENVAVDTENSKSVEIEIDGSPAYLIQKEGNVRILMDKNGHRFFLEGNISVEEAIKIMESIKTE